MGSRKGMREQLQLQNELQPIGKLVDGAQDLSLTFTQKELYLGMCSVASLYMCKR